MIKWSLNTIKFVYDTFKPEFWKYAIILVAFCTAAFDVVSTLGFFQLESNPVILFGGNLWVLALCKFAVVAMLSWQFWRIDKYKPGIAFMICTGMVLLIALQTLAGINNLLVAKEVAGKVLTEPTLVQKLNYVKAYMVNALVFFYYPLMVSLFSFSTYMTVRRVKP